MKKLISILAAVVLAVVANVGVAFGQVKHSFSIDVFGGSGEKFVTVNVGDTIEFVNGLNTDGEFKYKINGGTSKYSTANVGDTIRVFIVPSDTNVYQNIWVAFKNGPDKYVNLTIDYDNSIGIKTINSRNTHNSIVNNQLLIEQNNCTNINIYNVAGTLVKKASVTNNTANLSDLTTGLYFVTLTDENKYLVSFKIVKE